MLMRPGEEPANDVSAAQWLPRARGPPQWNPLNDLRSHVREGRFREAEALFDSLRASGRLKSPSFCNAMIQMYLKARRPDEAQAVALRMVEEGVAFTRTTFNLLLSLCAKTGNVEGLETVQLAMAERGVESDQATYNSLMDAFGRAGDIDRVGGVLADMQRAGLKPDVFTYQALVQALATVGRLPETQRVLEVMQAAGFEPQAPQYMAIVAACGAFRDIARLDNLMAHLQATGFPFDAPLYGSFILAYSQCQVLRAMHRIERTIRQDPRAAEIMIEVAPVFVQALGQKWSRIIGFLKRLHRLPDVHICLTAALYNAVARALTAAGYPEAAAAYAIAYVRASRPLPQRGLFTVLESFRRRWRFEEGQAFLEQLAEWKALSEEDLAKLRSVFRRAVKFRRIQAKRRAASSQFTGGMESDGLCQPSKAEPEAEVAHPSEPLNVQQPQRSPVFGVPDCIQEAVNRFTQGDVAEAIALWGEFKRTQLPEALMGPGPPVGYLAVHHEQGNEIRVPGWEWDANLVAEKGLCDGIPNHQALVPSSCKAASSPPEGSSSLFAPQPIHCPSPMGAIFPKQQPSDTNHTAEDSSSDLTTENSPPPA
eukprot:TRINITY_DN2261_c0_g1_i1.p1 TRINITY_DN2261_c0_g1~~TRINITY_DN2261_c0_g1_i1.p1  ORF type:complete len:595 (-),score=70.02 TRINITY_DN2261_c0_g1_i1:48-1832(-)